MELKVRVSSWGERELSINETIRGFDDVEKIGVRVGRMVRDFLRNVPLTRNGKHTQIDIRASYEEREPRASMDNKPKRRGKKAKADGAE